MLTIWARGKTEQKKGKMIHTKQLSSSLSTQQKKKQVCNSLWLAFTVHLFSQEVIFISKTNFPPSPQPE